MALHRSNELVQAPARRNFLKTAGTATLSATAVALIVGCESMAKSDKSAMVDPENDVAILNIALGLEWEAIGAYQLGAESGLLRQSTLDVAVLFQSQHKEHAEALVGAIANLGGQPVQAKSQADYAAGLNAGSLQNEVDVLRLAAKLEKGAANAYLGVIPAFTDTSLAQVSGRLAADETMHWTALASALGEPLPKNALSFG
jgi:rubrerythrin